MNRRNFIKGIALAPFAASVAMGAPASDGASVRYVANTVGASGSFRRFPLEHQQRQLFNLFFNHKKLTWSELMKDDALKEKNALLVDGLMDLIDHVNPDPLWVAALVPMVFDACALNTEKVLDALNRCVVNLPIGDAAIRRKLEGVRQIACEALVMTVHQNVKAYKAEVASL